MVLLGGTDLRGAAWGTDPAHGVAEELGIDRGEMLPLTGDVVLVEDRGDGADRRDQLVRDVAVRRGFRLLGEADRLELAAVVWDGRVLLRLRTDRVERHTLVGLDAGPDVDGDGHLRRIPSRSLRGLTNR